MRASLRDVSLPDPLAARSNKPGLRVTRVYGLPAEKIPRSRLFQWRLFTWLKSDVLVNQGQQGKSRQAV